MHMRIHVCAYEYTRIYPYTHIRVCSLVFMSELIVFLLSAGYCSKEKLDSTKKLNDYSTGSMKTSPDTLLQVYMS